MILMIPPQFLAMKPIIDQALELHGMTAYAEIAPRAGCRCFELTR